MKLTMIATCLLLLAGCSSDQHHEASVRNESTTTVGDEQPARVKRHEARSVRADAAAVRPEPIADVRATDADRRPVDQRDRLSDREITRRIHEAVVKDDSLSATAKNAKIVSQDGNVTLRGTVKSTSERTAIADHAGEVVGVAHVDNELEVSE